MNSGDMKYDNLMMSYLDGQCTAEEAISLLSWIAESEANQARFESFKMVWELTAFPMPDVLDVDAALDAVNTKIDAAEEQAANTVEMPWLRRNYKYVSGIAAALVVALFLGFLVVRPMNSTVTVASNDWNTETPYLLPDGSSVTFDGDASLSYSKQFGKHSRPVDFEGAAYFDVTKDETKPFIIHCDKVDVEVLGTSFRLNADKNTDGVTVDLYSGRVRMTSFDEKGKVLTSVEIAPTERGIWNEAEGLCVMSYPEVKKQELKEDRVLDFNDVSLGKIVETLEYIFEIKIDLPEAYANDKLTARFTDKDSVDEVLETIATVFGFEVFKTDDTYVIR